MEQYTSNPLDQTSMWDLSPQEVTGWEHYNTFLAENTTSVYPSPPSSQGQGARYRTPHRISPEQAFATADKVEDTVSVSTSFCPGAHPVEPNLIFSSSDDVLFYVHTEIVTAVARNAFSSFLPTKGRAELVKLPDISVTVNIILHALYGTSCAQNSPSLDDLIAAVDRMPFYGIVPKILIIPKTPLHMLLLSHAPLRPIDVYALAAFHDLEPMAEQASSHLLAFNLPSISDDLATRIGPVYLKRLFLLHVHRLAVLKDLLLQPPHPHAPSRDCSFDDQKKLTRAWALASAYLVWDARPDLSTHRIKASFDSLVKNLSCKDCEVSANARIREVIVKWAAIKCTI